MNTTDWQQLNEVVERLLLRNRELEDLCQALWSQKARWSHERNELLIEVDALLVELERMRKGAG